MNAKFIQSECVTDVLAGINEKRDATSRSLMLHYETSSKWLAEAIQVRIIFCKRHNEHKFLATSLNVDALSHRHVSGRFWKAPATKFQNRNE